ncbi:MAG: hypothetical protein NZM35_07680 [Chitinophagales bacterium]|nr:hypothetical protein [Chitinophagales bacterium]MDW8419832.1 hypothetical protein [Chitinophagales bacterium]
MVQIMRICSMVLAGLLVISLYAQPAGQKKTLKEKLEELPEALIAQPETGPDTNANKIISDRLSITVNPVWKKEGTLYFTDFKLPKADKEPVVSTLPLPEQKPVNQVIITLTSMKKSPAERKEQLIADLKKRLSAYYKQAGFAISTSELAAKVAEMVSAEENFTTLQGVTGSLFVYHDIQPVQSEYAVTLMLPDSNKSGIHFTQIRFVRFNYETQLPEDPMELRTFPYPDVQNAYLEFAKQMLKTIYIN